MNNNQQWKSAIKEAIEQLNKEPWASKNNSTNYDFVYDGKKYPPKEIYRIAAEIYETEHPKEKAPSLGGGRPTNEFFENLGFSITEKASMEIPHIDLNGKKLYKLSMGTLKKVPPYKGTSIVDDLNKHGFVLVHNNTGKGQARYFVDNLLIGDLVYITYGNQLSGIAKIISDVVPLSNSFPNGDLLRDWNARKVEHIKNPFLKDARDLKVDKRFWLPSGNSTLYEVPDLEEANKMLFEPYYNIRIIDSKQNNEIMSTSKEKIFFDNYKQYLINYKDELTENTIKGYMETIQNHLSKWCLKTDIDYQGLLNYNRKELFQTNKALKIAKETFNGMWRFQHYVNSLLPKRALNQILYGPPGTGKTYTTKEMAIGIANPEFELPSNLTLPEKRKQITEEYNRLYNLGQIAFTTFHQSFSYEDFIEGIKPETIDDNVTYSVVPGIFKEACEKADTKDESNFDEVLTEFKNDIIDNEKVTIDTGSIKFDVFYKGGKTFKINPKNSKEENPQYPASIENILRLYKNTPNENMYNPSYVKGILNFLFSEYGLKKYDAIGNQNNKNYVLIIDEINRGNVSAIFGELITLLEPDKRIGEDEEIVLKLPYSKDESFGVPSNLYIIGTMNTADRSVEALDTALRRRFVFEEVMPKPELLENITYDGFNLKELLETINERIEALLDRDHTIGHSYFIKLESGDKRGLSNVFKNNIIPLLQEYFYNDYDKIALVLGEGFVTEKTTGKVKFAKFKNIEIPETNTIYELLPQIENIEVAVGLLLNNPNE